MNNPILINVPTLIRTPRLILRAPAIGDGIDVYKAKLESPELRLWMPWGRDLHSIEDSEANCILALSRFLLREDLRFHIYENQDNEFIGCVSLHKCNWEFRSFMIGYWLKSSSVGKGYMTESVNALTRLSFSCLLATRLEIFCNLENIKSRKVAETLKFPREGILRNNDIFSSGEILCRDEVLYARTNLKGLPILVAKW